jgi:hypothetical protein
MAAVVAVVAGEAQVPERVGAALAPRDDVVQGQNVEGKALSTDLAIGAVFAKEAALASTLVFGGHGHCTSSSSKKTPAPSLWVVKGQDTTPPPTEVGEESLRHYA